MVGEHAAGSDGCESFQSIVQILEEWTETKTVESCGDFRQESIAIVQWVRFRVSGEVGVDFKPLSINILFLVAS